MDGYVYFIKAAGLPRVKIGYTTGQFSVRKDGIQTMSPVELHRLGVLGVNGIHPRNMEKELHELFAPYRIWGEWFEFPKDKIGTLKRCVKSKKNSRRRREGRVVFDYDAFKTYWKREISKDDWI